MKHIAKHIKPYLGLMTCSIILIGVQAYCDITFGSIRLQ